MTKIAKVTDEILKIARSFKQTVEMITDSGASTADFEDAKYLYLKPLYIFLTMPVGEKIDDIYAYIGKQKNQEKVDEMFRRIRTLAHFNGIGFTIREHDANVVKPKHFADEARLVKERTAKEQATKTK